MLSARDGLNTTIVPSGRSYHYTPQRLAQCLGFRKYVLSVCWDLWGRACPRNVVAGSWRIAGGDLPVGREGEEAEKKVASNGTERS